MNFHWLHLVMDTWLVFSGSAKSLLNLNEQHSLKPKSSAVNEMVIPRHSTTALMCEPVFTGTSGKALWYHNGIEVATVTSHSNAILHNRTYYAEQTVPDVGFLIITDISLDDEGDYWCRRVDSKHEGEVSHIVVAYVEQFPPDTRPVFEPSTPVLGHTVIGHCPNTKAVPSPKITWLLNGEPLDMFSRNIEVTSNGTLRIQQFTHQDIGVYECLVSNFAGRTSAKTFIDAKTTATIISDLADVPDSSTSYNMCHHMIRNGMTWFFIGCLATSCAVLLYLVCAVLMLRINDGRSRITFYSSLILRGSPNFAPGFRKVVAPMSGHRQSSLTNFHVNNM